MHFQSWVQRSARGCGRCLVAKRPSIACNTEAEAKDVQKYISEWLSLNSVQYWKQAATNLGETGKDKLWGAPDRVVLIVTLAFHVGS